MYHVYYITDKTYLQLSINRKICNFIYILYSERSNGFIGYIIFFFFSFMYKNFTGRNLIIKFFIYINLFN